MADPPGFFWLCWRPFALIRHPIRLRQQRPIRVLPRREDPDFGYSEARKEEIIKAYQERSSLRGCRVLLGYYAP